MKWLYRNEKGFTLVELMIVIVILGILTGIAIPSYMALRNRARVAAAKAELMNIATVLWIFEADNEGYPDGTFAELATALEAPPAYMDLVPLKDDWGTLYTYKPQGAVLAPGLYSEYMIYSCGPDMKDDGGAVGTDDIVVINGQLQ